MISIADLNELRANPKVAYPEYDEIRAAARRRNGGLADPRDIPAMLEVIARRGADWCMSVIGRPTNGDLHTIASTDADMLLIADERGLVPPLPPWLIQWTAESDATRRMQAEARTASLERDAAEWAEALAACGLAPDQLEVRPNDRSRGVHAGRREALRHVVPLVAVRSERRRHPAGRELCAVRHVRQLGDPVDQPATCVSCLAYTAQIQPDRSTS